MRHSPKKNVEKNIKAYQLAVIFTIYSKEKIGAIYDRDNWCFSLVNSFNINNIRG